VSLAAADAFMAVFGMKRVKLSKCKICRAEFQKRSMTHKCCSPECAQEFVRREREKNDRKETRTKLTALKTRSEWLKEAQSAFNAYIRYRDRDLPCISCGRFHSGDNHAGHYRSIGAAPQLRFHEDNVHLQCAPCNTYLSGNAIEYRIHLVERLGVERVDSLEADNSVRKWTIDDARRIKFEYRDKLKALKNERNL
jgi:hypothetical protein